MKFEFHADNTTVTDNIRKYTEQKIGILDKYAKDDLNARVVIKVYNDKSTKIKVSIGDIVASEKHADLYAAIDLVSEKLERQFRKEKTKRKTKKQYRESRVSYTFETEFEDE